VRALDTLGIFKYVFPALRPDTCTYGGQGQPLSSASGPFVTNRNTIALPPAFRRIGKIAHANGGRWRVKSIDARRLWAPGLGAMVVHEVVPGGDLPKPGTSSDDRRAMTLWRQYRRAVAQVRRCE